MIVSSSPSGARVVTVIVILWALLGVVVWQHTGRECCRRGAPDDVSAKAELIMKFPPLVDK